MVTAHPYLNFSGKAEEAFTFYRSVFGGEFAAVVRFRDMGSNDMRVPSHQLDRIAHIALPLGKGSMLMASDTTEGQKLVAGNSVYVSLDTESSEEAQRVFRGLSAGGQVEMNMRQTEWAENFGMCTDKFDIHWMVSYTGKVKLSDAHAAENAAQR